MQTTAMSAPPGYPTTTTPLAATRVKVEKGEDIDGSGQQMVARRRHKFPDINYHSNSNSNSSSSSSSSSSHSSGDNNNNTNRIVFGRQYRHLDDDDDDCKDVEEVKTMLRDALSREAELQMEKDVLKSEVRMLQGKMKTLDAKHQSLQARHAVAEVSHEIKGSIAQSRVGSLMQQLNCLQVNHQENLRVLSQLWLDRVFLRAMERGERGAKYAYYPNLAVLKQAVAIGAASVLNLDGALSSPVEGYRPFTIHYHSVRTCSELVAIFEHGLQAGDSLDSAPDRDALFNIITYANVDLLSNEVEAGSERQYLIVGARSPVDRYNTLLGLYLEQQLFPDCVTRASNIAEYKTLYARQHPGRPPCLPSSPCSGGPRVPHRSPYPMDVQHRIGIQQPTQPGLLLDYRVVIQDVWVDDPEFQPRSRDERRLVRVDLDFDQMIEIGPNGRRRELGFWIQDQ